jgi:hypothetical protein
VGERLLDRVSRRAKLIPMVELPQAKRPRVESGIERQISQCLSNASSCATVHPPLLRRQQPLPGYLMLWEPSRNGRLSSQIDNRMNSHTFNSVDRLLFGLRSAISHQHGQCHRNKECQAGSWGKDGRRRSKTFVSTGHRSGSTEISLRTLTPTQRSPMRLRCPSHFRQTLHPSSKQNRQTLNPSSSQNQNQSRLRNLQTQSQSSRWNRSSSCHYNITLVSSVVGYEPARNASISTTTRVTLMLPASHSSTDLP